MGNIRKCICCQTEYKYCPNCSAYSGQPRWRFEFDTIECKEIFDVVSAYHINYKTVDDIKEVVEKHKITDFSKFKESIKNLLNDIYTTEVSVEEVKDEDEVVITDELPKKKSRKKNKKVDVELENNTEMVADTIAE